MWHRFFGSGLVNPLDQMHSENAPSHPELLDVARPRRGRDTATTSSDSTRGIVMSKAYSRSSKYDIERRPTRSSSPSRGSSR